MILPDFFAFMWGSTCWVAKNTLFKFTAIMVSPFLFGDIFNGGFMEDPRIVDENIHAAEIPDGGVHHLLDIGEPGYIGFQRDGPAAGIGDLLGGCLGAVPADVGDGHRRAAAGQSFGDFPADSLPGAGDDGDLSIQHRMAS